MPMNPTALARASVKLLAAGLALAGVACISPDSFTRGDAGDQPPGGEGGGPGPGAGGGPANGSGGSNGGAGSNGAGGQVITGAGGRIVTGAGGAIITGAGGRTGTAGASGGVLLMDGFETGNVMDRYFWDSPTMTNLNPSGTPCGDWAVVPDDSNSANHMFSQRAVCSGPSWAAGGDGG